MRRVVLVTGGAGFVGSHVVVELLQSGLEVVIVDAMLNSNGHGIAGTIEKICGRPVHMEHIDMCDEDALDSLFFKFSFDAVVHLAALKSPAESQKKPLKYYRNNLVSSINLLNVMTKHRCNNLLYSSSATVYGSDALTPTSETAPLNPLSPYARTKAYTEQILRDCSHENLRIVVLRFFNPVGAHPSGLIGENPASSATNIMPVLCEVLCNRRSSVQVFGGDWPTEDGSCVRDFIHVVDVAKGHVIILNSMLESRLQNPYEEFNLGTGKGCSVLQLIDELEKASGKRLPYMIAGRRPGDIAISIADVSKVEKIIGWRAERSVSDMCRDAWKWTRKCCDARSQADVDDAYGKVDKSSSQREGLQ